MSTVQSTPALADNQNPIEPSAPGIFSIDLSINLGVGTAAIFHSLRDYAQGLREESLIYREADDVDSLLAQENELNLVMEMMTDIFIKVNDVCQAFVEGQRPEAVRQEIARRDEMDAQRVLNLLTPPEAEQ